MALNNPNSDRLLAVDNEELHAVRHGPCKLRLPGLKKLRTWPELDRGTQEAELYHLEKDVSESRNLAVAEPEGVARLMKLAEAAKAN